MYIGISMHAFVMNGGVIMREAMANICQGQLDYIHSHCMVSLSLSVCPCLMLTNPMIATLDFKRAVVNVWARTVSDATVSKK